MGLGLEKLSQQGLGLLHPLHVDTPSFSSRFAGAKTGT
jgi:hypothetical protein